MPKIREKSCSKCGIVKPKSEFHKDKNIADGYRRECKDCKRDYERVYKRAYRKFGATKPERVEIETWDQIDSIIREMAELQCQIQDEHKQCDYRIQLLKGYSNEIIEPALCHQISLRLMLDAFLKKHCPRTKTTKKGYRFGTLQFSRGKLEVELNTERARKYIGKP